MLHEWRAMKYAVLYVLFALLVSCGGGGGGGGTPPPPVPVPGGGGGEGTASSPVDLGTIAPAATHSGSVAALGKSYYKFQTDSNGGMYIINVAGASSTVSWFLYSNPTFSGSWLQDCYGGTCAGSAPDLSPGTEYYIELVDMDLSSTGYTLAVAPVVGDQTESNPLVLVVGVPYSGSVNASGDSYYKFHTGAAGEYSLSLAGIHANGSAALSVDFSSTNFAGPSLVPSLSTNYGWYTVNGLAADTDYYIRVREAAAYDVLYTITVNTGISQGSKSAPVPLTYGQDYAGGVDPFGASYYTFTPTNTGDSIVTLTTDTQLDVLVFPAPDYQITTQIQSCYMKTGQQCVISALNSGQTYYLEVGSRLNSAVRYTVNAGPGSNEGSLSHPVPLTVGTPHSAAIDGNGVSYYYFNTGPNGPTSGSGSYTISLSSSLTANWTLYSDSNFSTSVNINSNSYTSCTGTCTTTTNIDANRDYYLAVRNNSGSSGPFSITVNTGAGNSEGSVATPIPLTEGVPYSGRVAPGQIWTGGYSLYTFTPANNMVYLIRLVSVATGTTTLPWPGVEWTLYTDANFTSQFGDCNKTTYAGDTVGTTDYYAVPTKLTAGSPYYLRVDNFADPANTYTIVITPFDLAKGCNSGGTSTCFNFESVSIPGAITNNAAPPAPGSQSGWVLALSSIGTGNQSFESTTPGGPKGSYYSCFLFSATDVKWIGVSSRISSLGASQGTDSLVVFVDGTSYNNSWIDSGNTAWNRSVFLPPSGGAHNYEWCYSKTSNATGDYAEVDDIELNY